MTRSTGFAVAQKIAQHLGHGFDGVQHVEREPVAQEDHEGVAGGDGGRVARCQVDQFGVVARAPDQPWPGRLAEGNPELQGRTHAHQRLVKVVNRLDEVRLADHDVHVVGLVDGHHVPGQRRLGHAPMVPPPVSAIERVLDEPAGVKMVGTARLGVFAARLGTARERVRGVA